MVVLENTSVSIIEESGLKGSHRIMFQYIQSYLLLASTNTVFLVGQSLVVVLT